MNSQKIIKSLIFAGLWLVLIIPFFVANGMFFPYISGKNFAFRIIVEIIFALWLYLSYIDEKYRPKFSWITISVSVFVGVMFIADIFAVAPTKALWSNYERMDGWVTLIHMLMYLFVFGTMMKSEKLWLWFFRSSLVLSGVMSIFAVSEWMKTKDRVNTTLGNPIYVAVYFMFNFFFALILLYKDVIIKKINSKASTIKEIFSDPLLYVYSVFAILCCVGIWLSSTRGVILGLLGGVIITAIIISIFEKENKFTRSVSMGILAVIIVLLAVFSVTKNTDFVKNSPTLNKFAVITLSNIASQGEARQYVWPMAIKGFLEKPILGWGQDGFNYIFNKYYDPRMYNQEQWFDRAHDMPLDVLVAGGALGLLSYFSIFIALLYLIFKKRKTFGITETAILVGLLAAYFAQNLSVFDNLTSYMFFFTILAYVHSQYSENKNYELKNAKKINPEVANYIIAPVIILALGTSIWYANIRPINANTDLIGAMQSYQEGPSMNLEYFKKAISYNTFGSPEVREQLFSITPRVLQTNVDASVKQDFLDFTYSQIQAQLAKTPNDARYQLFSGAFFDNIGQYKIALPYLEKAVSLSPKKQTMLFELLKCYAYLGQKDKALETAKRAYELETDYSDAKDYYISMLYLNGKNSEAQKLMGTATTSSEIVIRSFLILAQEALGRGDKNTAIYEVQKAIALAPGFKQQGQQIIDGILKGTIK